MSTNSSSITEISFDVDGLLLYGTLHLPSAAQPPVVIGLHGLYSSQNSPKQIALAQACNQLGMAYFRFDHRGCDRSQGDFKKVTSLVARCRDLKRAIDALKGRKELGRGLGIFGSSMGGTVGLSVAAELELNPVVTFAAPLSSKSAVPSSRQSTSSASADIFLDAQKTDFNITGHLPQVSNILIFHGSNDQTVPLDHAREIHRRVGDPKQLIIQRDGDHRMSNKKHQLEFIEKASLWLKRGLIS